MTVSGKAGSVLPEYMMRWFRRFWPALIACIPMAMVYSRAGAQFEEMGFRAEWLQATARGLQVTGRPLIWIFNGRLTPAGYSDHPGLYLAAPYVAKWLGSDVVETARIMLVAAVILAGVIGMFGAVYFCRNWIVQLYACATYVILGWATLHDAYGVYVLQFVIPAAFLPWLLAAFTRDDEPPRWSGPIVLLLGVLGAALNVVRGHSATATLIGAALLILWTNTGRIRKVRLLGALLIGVVLVSASMTSVYTARDDYLASVGRPNAQGENGHVFWHQVYIGFGYTENPYVPEYKDEVGHRKVASVAGVENLFRTDMERYERVARGLVWGLVSKQPAFVLSQLATKASVLAEYLVFIGGVQPWLIVGWLGLLSRRQDRRLLLTLAVMLAFQSTFGLVIAPYPQYVVGFATVAALIGWVLADAAMPSAVLSRSRTRVPLRDVAAESEAR